MKYAIFDSRPQHSRLPFLFQDERSGRREYAIFDSEEEAETIAAKMNKITQLTTYIVKKIRYSYD